MKGEAELCRTCAGTSAGPGNPHIEDLANYHADKMAFAKKHRLRLSDPEDEERAHAMGFPRLGERYDTTDYKRWRSIFYGRGEGEDGDGGELPVGVPPAGPDTGGGVCGVPGRAREAVEPPDQTVHPAAGGEVGGGGAAGGAEVGDRAGGDDPPDDQTAAAVLEGGEQVDPPAEGGGQLCQQVRFRFYWLTLSAGSTGVVEAEKELYGRRYVRVRSGYKRVWCDPEILDQLPAGNAANGGGL